MAEELIKSPPTRAKRRYVLPVVLTVLLLGALGGSWYFYRAYQTALLRSPAEEHKRLLRDVGEMVALPSEEPEIATVQDATKLSSAVLAARAQTGDKLLIFNQARRIVIYRPSSKKVIDILTVKTPDASEAATPNAGTAASPAPTQR